MHLSRSLRAVCLVLCLTGVVALAAAPASAVASSTAGPGSTAVVLSPDVNKVTCGSRTDWFRLWTQIHGYPVCYANSGDKWVAAGLNPPNDTWTTFGYCSGNNAGRIYFWYWDNNLGNWGHTYDNFGKWHCNNFTSTWGRTVEVYRISIS